MPAALRVPCLDGVLPGRSGSESNCIRVGTWAGTFSTSIPTSSCKDGIELTLFLATGMTSALQHLFILEKTVRKWPFFFVCFILRVLSVGTRQLYGDLSVLGQVSGKVEQQWNCLPAFFSMRH